ncbi:MAG: ABC transporter permease [Treponema sp.]|nr:ABC transporter permease [Treponema sp.]
MANLQGVLKKLGSKFNFLLMPIAVFLLLLGINIIADIIRLGFSHAFNFFIIQFRLNNLGYEVLGGNLISILNGASELAIITIGMTLVTASSRGQDIGVGAVAAIAASVFFYVIRASSEVTLLWVLFAFIICAIAAMVCGVFNGTLVAKVKIQPMIATLIMFTSGRSIAYAINGGASPKVFDDITLQIGGFIHGVPIPTPVFIVLLYSLIFFLIFKFTNLRLYVQSIGINEKSARLNGINPIAIKILTFVILGFCVAGAGVINACRMQRVDHLSILGGIEMDAILAVAIGGNLLSGGKFSIIGSIIGAYTIETLNVTLLRLGVLPEPIRVYKATFIILLMLLSSPVLKNYIAILWSSLSSKFRPIAKEEV